MYVIILQCISSIINYNTYCPNIDCNHLFVKKNDVKIKNKLVVLFRQFLVNFLIEPS